MAKIRVFKYGRAYLTDDIREAGFEGDIKVTIGTAAAVMEKPGARIPDIIKTLDILKTHYEILLSMEETNKEEQDG